MYCTIAWHNVSCVFLYSNAFITKEPFCSLPRRLFVLIFLSMKEQLAEKVIGRSIRCIEHSGVDDLGYTSDSIVFHMEGAEELRVYVEVCGSLPHLCIELSSSDQPLSGVYPRFHIDECGRTIEDITYGYSDDRLSSIRLLFPGNSMQISVSDSDLYSMKID